MAVRQAMDQIKNFPTPTTAADTKDVSASGQITIDGLLWGTAFRSEASGNSTAISFSFSGPGHIFSSEQYSGYSFGFGEPWSGMERLTSSEATEFSDILAHISRSINIIFQETSESSSNVGTIRIAWTGYERPENSAWAYFPAETASAGDIWLNSSVLNPDRSDLFFRSLLIHELGHALGLKHPDETGLLGNQLPGSLDSVEFTIMSYNPSYAVADAVATDLWPQSLMALDILALQHLYGPSLTTQGDDTYQFETRERYYETIWDNGGEDTLLFQGSTHLLIDLTPGSWSDIGTVVHYWDKDGNLLPEFKTQTLFVTADTVIEHVITDNGHDVITGNDANNKISSGAGHDTVYGAAGDDEIIGGSGSDLLLGEGGSDTISGGTGPDRIFAGTTDDGSDYLAGGGGADTIGGGDGDDLIIGSGVSGTAIFDDSTIAPRDKGDDVLYGGAGNDTLVAGGWANDVSNNLFFDFGEHVASSEGNNSLWGGSGSDLLIGANDADQLGGGAGDDTLVGEAGNDSLWGATGDDSLTGGDGIDTFIFAGAHGFDVISDFTISSDILDLSQLADATALDAIIAGSIGATYAGMQGILLTTGEHSAIFLAGLTIEDLPLVEFSS